MITSQLNDLTSLIAGRVIPIGGTSQGPTGDIAMIQGDKFIDPLSSLNSRVQGAYLDEEHVMPSAGGYQHYLDCNIMACEARVAEALRHYKDAVFGKVFIDIVNLVSLWAYLSI